VKTKSANLVLTIDNLWFYWR